MKKILLSFALAVGLLASASTLQAQVNMSRYITLTVTNWSAIKLKFKAAAAGTPIRIVSGSNTRDTTVGTSWTGFANYTADGTTMTVYGDITGLECSNNNENLTAIDLSHNTELSGLFCSSNQLTSLDLSHNTQLEKLGCSRNSLTTLDLSSNTQLTELYCYANNFSTQALDDIYCALPDRKGKENGKMQPVLNSSDPYHATVLATNKAKPYPKTGRYSTTPPLPTYPLLPVPIRAPLPT